MIKIALCDDNSTELSHTLSLIEDYHREQPATYTCTVFHDGFELMNVLEQGEVFDIYCLDIIMQGFNGIALGKEIRSLDLSAQIIFFTSSPDFALESYAVRALDYVLKPVTKERLFPILDEVWERIEEKVHHSVVVKSEHGLQKLLLSNIIFIEAMGRKVIYHTLAGKNIECYSRFAEVCDELLKHSVFLKPHRSYLVNMNYIDTIHNRELLLQTSVRIPVAQGKAKEIREHYLAFQMEGN